MSGPSTIAGILRRILNHTAKVNPTLRASLRKGLSKTQIKERTRDFPFRLPREVEELYQWRDGMNVEVHDDSLFHNHYFLPLHKALEEYQMNLTWRVLSDGDPTIVPNLLPLFSFQGEFYGAYCRREKQDTAPIYFVFHSESIVYDSLTSMLSAILECYETGAYQPTIENDTVATIVDEQRVAEIKLRWNPVRNAAYQKASSRGTFYTHP